MHDTALESRTATTSLRIIAAAILFACFYYASSVILTLICSIFIAFILDPGVKLLERVRLPRWLGAMLMVLLLMTVAFLGMYLLYSKILDFLNDLPTVGARIKDMVMHFLSPLEKLEKSTATFLPREPSAMPAVRIQSESVWTRFIFRGIGSIYAIMVTVMFMPFLVFFMLTSKNQVWATTLNLFRPERRQLAEEVIRGISQMVRQYVLGNFLVGLVSAVILTPVFFMVELRYALLLGPLCAFLNLVPYIGVALAMLPPLLLALVDPSKTTLTPFIVIGLAVAMGHFVAVNLLTPALVGHRVKLNALSVTVAMMFWGWLWGAIGLVLAVPITAAFKAVCDNLEPLKPLGELLGES